MTEYKPHTEQTLTHVSAVSPAWRRVAMVSNVGLGLLETIAGAGTTGSALLSVIGDGVHNIGDGLAYGAQGNDVLRGLATNSAKEIRRRRMIYAGLALSSVWVMGRGITDTIETIEHPQTQVEETNNTIALGLAAAAAVNNTGLYLRFRRGRQHALQHRHGAHDAHEHALDTHLLVDLFSSAAALAGAVGQRYNIDIIDSAGAAVSGMLGAVAFRPTTKNVTNVHAH